MIVSHKHAKNGEPKKGFGHVVKTHRWRVVLVLALVVSLVVQDAFFYRTPVVLGQTYTVTQDTWVGGVGAKDTPWTTYASIAGLNATSTPGSLILTTSTQTLVQTDDGTTNTGFNLTGKTFSSTEMNGTSGDGAGVKLTSSLGAAQSTTYTTAGSGTWTAPAGVTSVKVEAWGGGGGSGYIMTANTGGGGGGGGAYARQDAYTVVPNTGYTYTVGGRGAYQNACPSALTGGASSFNTTLVVAVGGGGGCVPTGGTGGSAAASTGISAKFSGGNGSNGTPHGGAGGGSAGSASNGNSAVDTYSTTAAVTDGSQGAAGCGFPVCTGNTGYSPGGGAGSGANSTAANSMGSQGGVGQIKLTYQVATYANSGTFTSGAINIPNVGWMTFSSSTSNYTGTSVRIKVRSSPTSDMTARYADFSGCTAIAEGARLSTGGCVTDGDPYVQYEATLATSNTAYTPYLNSVTIGYSTYNTSGNLVSSMFDTAQTTNVIGGMQWTEDVSLPAGTGVTMSVVTTTAGGVVEGNYVDLTSVTANCSKDGGTGLVTCTDLAIPDSFKTGSNARYMKYKVAMTAASLSPVTPTVGSVTMTYVVNAPPEVQNVTAVQNANGTVSVTYETRDTDTLTGQVANRGHVTPSFKYYNGATWETMTALAAGDTDNKSVDATDPTDSWTSYSATWTPVTDFPNQYLPATVMIRVTVDDNEGANRTGSADSAVFAFDTLAPASNDVIVYASSSPAILAISSTDVNSSQMMISTDPAYTGGLWIPYSTRHTMTLSNPSTVYVKFKDAYSNESSASAQTTPTSLTSVMIQDTSNILVTPAEYRLFVAWKALAAGNIYKLYRSTDQSTWSLSTTISEPSTNFYTDLGLDPDTTYYYRLTNTDAHGNISFTSASVSGKPNGTQDSGEGGGGAAEAMISAVASSTTPGTATITWNTDMLANSEVGYSTTPSDFSNIVRVATMVDTAAGNGPHTVSIAGLTPDTTYYFHAKSTTIAGGITTDNNGGQGYTFKTKNGPTITNTTIDRVINTTARIKWNTSSAANSAVYYSTNSDLSSSSVTSSDTNVTSHDMTITGLSSGTQYYFYVQSTDGGSITEYDKHVVDNIVRYYDFRTTSDVTAPVLSNVASSTGVTTANVTWTTDELADSWIQYGTTTDYASSTTRDLTRTIQHAQSIADLSANTLYYFRVISSDENGNNATGTEKTFTTTAAPDTTPPVITSVTTTGIGLTTATVTWITDEAADSIVDFGATTAYGQLMGNTTESVPDHTVTLTSLVGNTTYKYRILSKDSAGNLATDDNNGAGHEFTTALDITPPIISGVATVLVSDTSAVISWTTNEAAVSLVSYGESTAYGTTSATTTSYATNHSITLTGLTREVTYYYRVTSIDASGNSTTDDNSAAGYTFVTTREPGRNVTTGVQPRDTGAPFLSNIQITDITDRGATVSWSTDEPTNALITYGTTTNYGTWMVNIDESLTTHSLAIRSLRPDTAYHFKLYSEDAFGNRGSSSDQSFETLTTLEALTAAATTTESTLPIEEEEGTSPEDVKKAFEDAVSSGPVSLIEALLNAMVKNPLIANLSEKLFVSSFTDVANRVISAPTITGTSAKVEVTGNTAKISWATDKKSSSEVGYAPEEEYGKDKLQPYTNTATTPDEFDTNHIVIITGLVPNTTYHFQLRSKGIAGPTAKSRDDVFRTQAELPVISGAVAKDVTEHVATITWKTNVPTSANVEYSADGSGQTLSQGQTDLLRDHFIVLKDLKDGMSYSVIIKATDEAGSTASNEPIRFTTLKDTAPPLIATLTSESTFYSGKESKVQTIISWETDEPSTSQVFYKEGVSSQGTVTSVPEDATLVKKHTVVITKFKPGAVYKFWVVSKDIVGNESRSKDFTVLTPQQKQTVIDIIINNFEQVFGWTQRVGI